jgi:tetratricopeptide (TPR) repeat protein
MKLLGNRLTIMVGVALLLVVGSLLFAPTIAGPLAPAPVTDPASVIASGVTPRQGYADRIISDMKTRLQSNANDDTSLAQLGLAYLQKARETSDPTFYTQAETVLRKALAINPRSFDATAAIGSLELSRHQFREALDWGRKAQSLAPQKAYAYGVIGDAQIELGDYDQAVATFQQMINLRPDLSSYARVSYARELYGDVEGAIQAMRQAAEAGGPAPENAGWTHVQLGNLYFNSGRLAEAEHEYNTALAVYPGYFHAQAGLAAVRAAQGRPGEAVALYKAAVAVVPLPQYVQALGDLYAATGDAKNAQAQYDLVSYIFHVFEVNGVDVSMEKAAFLADQNQDAAEAVQLAQTAAAWRHDIHTQDALAWTLYRAGRYADALAAEQQALRLGTQNALFYFHLGLIYNGLGDSANARANLQRALAINPHFSVKYAPQATALLEK